MSQVAEIQPSFLRVGLMIDMRAPTIILPKTSKSPDLLLFRFDSLQIRNSIKSEYLADESIQDRNDIRLKVKAMQISRYGGICLIHRARLKVVYLDYLHLKLYSYTVRHLCEDPVILRKIYVAFSAYCVKKMNIFELKFMV